MPMKSTLRRSATLAALALLAACAAPETPLPITPPADVKDAAVARRPVEPPAAPVRPTPVPPIASQPASPPAIVVPAGAQYVCVSDTRGQRTQTAIEFAPKVAALCKRHPEMGPCQYERDLCRSSGGRVYAAGGQEITRQIEDEYDRKVLRVRFRAN
jgi:hypothetical protein